jgi:hypothetical protein
MSSTNRFIAFLYAAFGIVIFGIMYFQIGSASPFIQAVRFLIATCAVFVAVQGVFKRDVAALVMAAGLGALAFDAFAPNRIFLYGGLVLVLGGFFLVMRRHNTNNNTIPRHSGA